MIIASNNQATGLQLIKKELAGQPDILKTEDKVCTGTCSGHDDVEAMKKELEAMKLKMAEKGELARKSFLLGTLGTAGLVATAAIASPIIRLAIAIPSTIALFKGCQTMYDKVMH
jgi:hypothetical protein